MQRTAFPLFNYYMSKAIIGRFLLLKSNTTTAYSHPSLPLYDSILFDLFDRYNPNWIEFFSLLTYCSLMETKSLTSQLNVLCYIIST